MGRAQELSISHRVPRPHLLTSSEFAEATAKLPLLCLCKPGLGRATVSQGHLADGQVVSEHTHTSTHTNTHMLTHTLCAYTASLTQGDLPPWNALTFFPLRRKVFKQMLLQKRRM